MSKLYHKEFGFPYYVKFQMKYFIDGENILFSKHLQEQQGEEWRRQYNLNDITIELLKQGEIFEVETDNTGKMIKAVIRVQYNDEFDICMPIIKSGKNIFVKTMWLNHKSDKHKTLNKNLYEII